MQTILYVDDERSNRLVFEHAFAHEFDVKVVTSGAEALSFLEKNSVALVVTDQQMPEMTGNELLKTIKEKYPNIIRMIVSAFAEIDPILEAVNLGVVHRYVIKPWDPRAFRKLLKWGLEAHAMGLTDSTVQVRLLETERLATLGALTQALAQDMRHPLTFMLRNLERLETFSKVVRELKNILSREHDLENMGEDLRRLTRDFFQEYEQIVSDSRAGFELLNSLTKDIDQVFTKRDGATNRSIDLEQVIQLAARIVKPMLAEVRAELRLQIGSDLPKIKISQSELVQVIINLVKNAAEAVKNKGIDLAGRVTLSAVQNADRVFIRVLDNGEGMTPKKLSEIGTFSTQIDGAGLGLMQCRRIVGARGGELDIRSSPGQGTEVSFWIPALT